MTELKPLNTGFAIVIGINKYTNGIPSLKNAVNDAQKIAEILETKYGYQVLLLLDESATLSRIKKILTAFQQQTISFNNQIFKIAENDRIFFYFAGHGLAFDGLESAEGPQGFIVPQDGKLEEKEEILLPMTELHDALMALPNRHLLVILDCCFAGSFRWAGLNRDIVPSQKLYRERYERFTNRKARQVITSAAYDQKAMDGISSLGKRGEIDGHSPFAEALLKCLDGEADYSKDGAITATELYLYLQSELGKQKVKQTPGIFQLKKHDDGEYIFPIPGFNVNNLEKAPPLDDNSNPYRSLASFDEIHQDLFFGRKKVIEDLYRSFNQKEQPKLIAVLGASGTGKSSLVKAGFLPRLRQDGWYVVNPFRPGKSPFSALAAAILLTQKKEAGSDGIKFLENELRRSPKKLTDLAADKLLLVIDQFEELVTDCPEAQKDKFLAWLEDILRDDSGKVRVIITLRTDFKGHFLKELFDEKEWGVLQFTVPMMTQDEYREIIEKPAAEKVLYFEPPELVDELINEVVNMPGALPLLSFTLSQLYFRCCDRWQMGGRSRAMTGEDYQKLGGVMGSLKETARKVFDKLIKEKKATEQTIRHVMLRMVSVSGDELARRRVPMWELEYPAPKNGEVEEVIEAFIGDRLLVKGATSDGEEYVEPAHDALVTGWDRILKWKNQQQESLLLQRRLTPAAVEWKEKQEGHTPNLTDLVEPVLNWLDVKFYHLGRVVDGWKKKERSQKEKHHSRFLWHKDPRLDLLKEVLESDDSWFNRDDEEFVRSSLLRRVRNVRQFWIIVTAVMTVLIGFSGTIFIQGLNGKIQGMNARSQELFNSHNQLEALEESLRAARQLKWVFGKWSWGISQETKIITAARLQQTLYYIKEQNRLQGHSSTVNSVIFSPDGKILASASNHGSIKLWNLDGILIETLEGHKGEVWSLDFNPDGTILASIDENGMVKLWNMEDKSLIKDIDAGGERIENLGLAYNLKFAADGQLLATAGGDKNIKLWELNGNLQKELKGHDGAVRALSFSPNGRILASASEDKTVKLWNIDASESLDTFEHKTAFTSLSFSANGELLAAAAYDGIIKIWNTSDRSEERSWQGHISQINHISFNSDGKRLISTSQDRTLKMWKLEDETEKEEATFHHRGAVWSANFNPNNNNLIASGSADRSIKLWNLDRKPEIIEIIKEKSPTIDKASFSADGKILVTLADYNILELWNLEQKQYQIITHNYDYNFYDVNLSSSGRKLAVSMNEQTDRRNYLYLLDVASLLNQRDKNIKININNQKLIRENELIWNVSFSIKDRFFAYGLDDSTIKMRTLDGRLYKPPLRGHTQAVKSVSFSPKKSQLLAYGSADGTVRLFSNSGKDDNDAFMKDNNEVNIVDFSSDGQWIASAHQDWTIELRGTNNNTPSVSFSGHNSNVYSINFANKNSQLFVSASGDTTVKLWSINNDDRALVTFTEHKSPVLDVSFSADDKKLISVGADNTIVQRSLDVDNLLMRGCYWLKDYLKQDIPETLDIKKICDRID